MQITIYQFLTPLFAVLVILQAFFRLRRGETNLRKFIIWVIVWGGVSLIVLVPSSVGFLSDLSGIKNGINALIFFGFILLFFMVFKVLILIEHLERDLTTIIRRKALEELKEETENSEVLQKNTSKS